jgi:hypothetical protein
MNPLPTPQEIAFTLCFPLDRLKVGSRIFAVVVLVDIAFWSVVAYAWRRHGVKMLAIKCSSRFMPVLGALWM